MTQPMKACPQCHRPAALNCAVCMVCGHQFRTQFVPDRTTVIQPLPYIAGRPLPGTHSVPIAILLAFVIPGAGQCYNRQYAKAAAVFLVCSGLGAAFALFALSVILIPLAVVVAVVIPLASIAGLADAGMVANRINKGEYVTEWQCF